MDEMREKSGKEQQGEIEKIDLIEFLRSFQYGIIKVSTVVPQENNSKDLKKKDIVISKQERIIPLSIRHQRRWQ